MCNCNKDDHLQSNDGVPNFTVTGFTKDQPQLQNTLQGSLPDDVLALEFKSCVKASIENGKICFKIPYFGKQCITPPIPLPEISGSLKACFESCGSIIPTGAKVSIYYNDTRLFNYTVGNC